VTIMGVLIVLRTTPTGCNFISVMILLSVLTRSPSTDPIECIFWLPVQTDATCLTQDRTTIDIFVAFVEQIFKTGL
jgi:hypothetical protein